VGEHVGRKSDLERGSQQQGVWQESGIEACEEGEGEKSPLFVKTRKFCNQMKINPARSII